jgi:hypothetical protein
MNAARDPAVNNTAIATEADLRILLLITITEKLVYLWFYCITIEDKWWRYL